MTHSKRFQLLFLCTGNSARSIIAEYVLRKIASDKFDVMSAGSHPKGQPHPSALKALKDVLLIDPAGARSKSWNEFEGTKFDFVITLCDDAREHCPVWPGQPIIAHWGMEDPASATGTPNEERAFREAAILIRRRIELFASLPFHSLDRLRLESQTRAIGNQD